MHPLGDDPLPAVLARRLSRRAALARAAGTGLVAALASVPASRSLAAQEETAMTDATPAANGSPTVVLVHGAFADASGWSGVISRLQAQGIPVTAPANPLRGVASDAAYIASAVNQIPGPVLLVGHSYGGMVISNASPQTPNVVGLVYVCAFIPEEGESIQALAEQSTDSLLGSALVPAQYPSGGAEPGVELYIDPARFHEVFCADLPAEQAAVMAVSQRPGSGLGFAEPSGPVGWKTLPSWALITPNDLTIGASGLRLMAERAGAVVAEVDASHVAMMSQPEATTDLILAALGSLG